MLLTDHYQCPTQILSTHFIYTLGQISNWPPSFCYILGKVFREKYK